MRNLAGDANAEKEIIRELGRVGIEPVESDVRKDHPDVKVGVVGKLGPFEFRRNWYYWVAYGPVPLEVAEELYEDPVCRADVRSGGDCACRPPETWADFYDADGKELAIDDLTGHEEKTYRELIEKGFLKQEGLDKVRFIRADISERTRTEAGPILRQHCARAVVNVFHIDSELGLYLFVQALKKHGLVDHAPGK